LQNFREQAVKEYSVTCLLHPNAAMKGLGEPGQKWWVKKNSREK